MKRLIVLISVLLITSIVSAEELKKADMAGTWYPSSEGQLTSMLQGYLDGAELKTIPPNIIAIIVPHAGYIYSGPVAAYAYKAVAGLDIDTIILIGFCHRKYYNAISVYDRGSFETPLGPLEVDSKFARDLVMSDDKFYYNPEAFKGENSIELQLPFMKYIFKDKDVKIVPIAMGVQSKENIDILADKLYEALKDRERFLIVASTDMSHYHPYNEANTIDSLAIKTIKEYDHEALFNKTSLGKCELCGIGTVMAAMIVSEKLGADKIDILKYANSGDTVGRKDNVVGYLSAAIYKTDSSENDAGKEEDEVNGMLNDAQKKRLLQIARETIDTFIKTRKKLEFKEDDEILNKELGAFVTIHKKGELRGCIGNIVGRGPLYLTIRDMAIESSTGDPRFSPVSKDELKDIDIEISVLSELEKIDDPERIELGKHGVLVRSGFRSGVFLPQVATETGWSKEEFMSNLCAHKAGLPPDAWKTGNADIYIYSAEVFGEKTDLFPFLID